MPEQSKFIDELPNSMSPSSDEIFRSSDEIFSKSYTPMLMAVPRRKRYAVI